MPRPAALHKSQNYSKNRPGQVVAENTLVQAGILAAETLEEGGHSNVLVEGAREIVRESAPGDVRRDLWDMARRAADASDPGTCETATMWSATYASVCVLLPMERHTYRMQGTKG